MSNAAVKRRKSQCQRLLQVPRRAVYVRVTYAKRYKNSSKNSLIEPPDPMPG